MDKGSNQNQLRVAKVRWQSGLPANPRHSQGSRFSPACERGNHPAVVRLPARRRARDRDERVCAGAKSVPARAMNLSGKSREDIVHMLRTKTREELLEIIISFVQVEQHFTAAEI